MAVQKPQKALEVNGQEIYPLTCADQIILTDGTRLGADGTVPNSEALGGIAAAFYQQIASFGSSDYGKVLSCDADGVKWVTMTGNTSLTSVEGVTF